MPEPLSIDSIARLDELLALSHERPVMLLKHSTRCGISARAYEQFLRFASSLPEAQALPAIVLVVESRPVSNEVSRRLGVAHESPQAILVVGGKAVWSATHGDVDARRLARALPLAG